MKLVIILFFCSVFLLAGCVGMMGTPGALPVKGAENAAASCVVGAGMVPGRWMVLFLSETMAGKGYNLTVDSDCNIKYGPVAK